MAVTLVFALAFAFFCGSVTSQGTTTLVPAIITFGDSIVDVGNNDYIPTIFKADHPPYGRDFINKKATGRFCNGKLATDITAEKLGFKSYAPAYLSPEASGNNLLLGANFASAGAGYDDRTSLLSFAIPLSKQLKFYKEYQNNLTKVAGRANATTIITKALYLVSAGSSDFVQNYYINPLLKKVYTPDQYSSYLVAIFTNYIKSLYGLGARRIGVTSLPPLGCLPLARTLFGSGLFGFNQKGCVSRLNTDAQLFNTKINSAASYLRTQYPDLRIVIFDVYKPLFDIVSNASTYGFTEASKGCCGTGIIETTSFLCNQLSLGTCSNASQYVFWDSVHPSEAANRILADKLIIQGFSLIT